MSSDWNPPEAFIEDCLFESVNSILQHVHVAPWRALRQFPIPNAGIADMVIFTEGRIFIVEVKRNTIDEGAVAQLLRYMGAMRIAADDACSQFGELKVEGILCAPTITTGAKFAMRGCGSAVVFYQCSPTISIEFGCGDLTSGGFPDMKATVDNLIEHSGDFLLRSSRPDRSLADLQASGPWN